MFPLIPNLAAGILGKTPGPKKLRSKCIKACPPESLLKNSVHPPQQFSWAAHQEHIKQAAVSCASTSLQMVTSTVTQSQTN